MTRWALGLTLPGAATPVTVGEPGGSFVPCVGGRLRLSPFYAEQTLSSDIKALGTSIAPPPFAAATAAEPATCSVTALRATVTSVASGHDGSTIELRLANTGSTCVLPEGWPTVKLQTARGGSQTAKIFADSAATQAGRKLLTTYEHGSRQSTALTFQYWWAGLDRAVRLGLRAERLPAGDLAGRLPHGHGQRHGRRRGAGQAGAHLRHRPGPVVRAERPGQPGRGPGPERTDRRAIAGQPVPGQQHRFLLRNRQRRPDRLRQRQGRLHRAQGKLRRRLSRPYGEYIGETGSFMNWQGCTTSGLAWDQANYNMATDNVVDFSTGLGTAAYWFAAGPGRDPHYNGTAAEAQTWGRQQAQAALTSLGGKVFDFRYIFMDIENNGVPPDQDGWNTVWDGPCGGIVKAGDIPANVDFADWVGFATTSTPTRRTWRASIPRVATPTAHGRASSATSG